VSATEERALRIGEVAERVGVTTRTIRYYEELGLLPGPEPRSKGAHRQYGEPDVARLRELLRLRDLLGLTLEELVALADAEEARAALRDQWYGDPSDEERKAILDRAIELARQQLELVDARRRRLDDFADELTNKLAALEERRRELRAQGGVRRGARRRREARVASVRRAP
jgi:DNA-binding transcriptional MerR regulator